MLTVPEYNAASKKYLPRNGMTALQLPFSKEQRSNFYHLYADILWWGILGGSSISFVGIFATRVGATSFQLGLLSAGPAVINLLLSLPAGRWLESRPIVRTAFITSILNRAGYLPLVFLPLVVSAQFQIWSLIILTLAMAIPAVALGIAFNAMFADLVPPDQRAQVVGRRNALVALSLTVTSLLSGQILDRVAYPLNYQIVFSLGVIGGAVSCYHIGRLRLTQPVPPRIGRPLMDMERPGSLRLNPGLRFSAGLRFLARSGGRDLLRLDLLRGPFGKFIMAYLAFYTMQYLPVPLFPIFFVDELNLTDGTISLGTALFHFAMLLTSMLLARLSIRWGYRRLLLVAAGAYSVYPIMNGATSSVNVYLLASVLGGASWGILGGSLLNLLMDRVPAGDRPAHMALHNLALNLGILLGSFSGPLVNDLIGLRPALITSGGLRILVTALLMLWT